MNKTIIPGLVFVAVISYFSTYLNNKLGIYLNLEPITIGIIVGMIINNFILIPRSFIAGIKFSSKSLLEIGIILLGVRISTEGIQVIGLKGVLIVVAYVFLTLIITKIIGRLLKVDGQFIWLIGIGTAVCGSSAIAALAPSIDAEEKAPIAISYINIMAAVGLIIYTIIGFTNIMTEIQFGIWSGLTLHGVGHAIASAFSLGQVSGEIGTFVKMTRVATLAPLVIILSNIYRRKAPANDNRGKVPGYLIAFFLAALLNILNIIPATIVDVFEPISSRFIIMAMVGLGLTVKFTDVKAYGAKVGLLVLTTFIIGSVMGLLLTYFTF